MKRGVSSSGGGDMDTKLKQFEQKFRKVKEEMRTWEELQTRFASQFRNASAIIQRSPVIQESSNFGSLESYRDVPEKVLGAQMDSLQNIMDSMNLTLDEFGRVVASLEKIVRDGRQLFKTVSRQQQQLRIGVRPTLEYCMERLESLRDIHESEYRLKSSLLSALFMIMFKPNDDDLSAVQQILIDQPNICKKEVDSIFNMIFTEDH